MSKEKRNYSFFIDDIIYSIEKIENYVENMEYKNFIKDNKTIDAVIRNFEIIGEAANNIPLKIIKQYPQVEWQEIIGFRNVMIHHYFGIDTEAVWETIKNNLPDLKKHIKKVKENISNY